MPRCSGFRAVSLISLVVDLIDVHCCIVAGFFFVVLSAIDCRSLPLESYSLCRCFSLCRCSLDVPLPLRRCSLVSFHCVSVIAAVEKCRPFVLSLHLSLLLRLWLSQSLPPVVAPQRCGQTMVCRCHVVVPSSSIVAAVATAGLSFVCCHSVATAASLVPVSSCRGFLYRLCCGASLLQPCRCCALVVGAVASRCPCHWTRTRVLFSAVAPIVRRRCCSMLPLLYCRWLSTRRRLAAALSVLQWLLVAPLSLAL